MGRLLVCGVILLSCGIGYGAHLAAPPFDLTLAEIESAVIIGMFFSKRY